MRSRRPSRADRGYGLRRGGLTAAPALVCALAFALLTPAFAGAQTPATPSEPEPEVLSGEGDVWRWGTVERRTLAREDPDVRSKGVYKLQTRTPENTTNPVIVLERLRKGSTTWLRVRLPVLPNGTTGWIPSGALGPLYKVRTHLLIDRRKQTARLENAGRTVFRARIGVGEPRWPTPKGEFYIRNRLSGFNSPVYGPLAFGLNARSAVLTDWPGGGFIGIHGTNRPDILPGRVSHGCIRLRNADIRRLDRLMPIGTPVSIS